MNLNFFRKQAPNKLSSNSPNSNNNIATTATTTSSSTTSNGTNTNDTSSTTVTAISNNASSDNSVKASTDTNTAANHHAVVTCEVPVKVGATAPVEKQKESKPNNINNPTSNGGTTSTFSFSSMPSSVGGNTSFSSLVNKKPTNNGHYKLPGNNKLALPSLNKNTNNNNNASGAPKIEKITGPGSSSGLDLIRSKLNDAKSFFDNDQQKSTTKTATIIANSNNKTEKVQRPPLLTPLPGATTTTTFLQRPKSNRDNLKPFDFRSPSNNNTPSTSNKQQPQPPPSSLSLPFTSNTNAATGGGVNGGSSDTLDNRKALAQRYLIDLDFGGSSLINNNDRQSLTDPAQSGLNGLGQASFTSFPVLHATTNTITNNNNNNDKNSGNNLDLHLPCSRSSSISSQSHQSHSHQSLASSPCHNSNKLESADRNGSGCRLEAVNSDKYREIMKNTGVLWLSEKMPRVKTDMTDLRQVCELGSGTCGHVIKMKHPANGKMIAVKQMRVSGIVEENRRIIMDLDVVRKCHDCANIVKCLGYIISESDVWICMELMSMCFDKLLKRIKKPIPEPILGKLVVSTLNALNYLKETHNLIHRDIKPSNILIDESGSIKLCDFGISGNLINSNALSRNNAGCAAYMAPERIEPADLHNPVYDIRADVWSLGITLVELSTGQYPYSNCQNEFQVMSTIVSQEAPILRGDQFSAEFKGFIAKCLVKDVAERPKYKTLLKHPLVTKYKNLDVDVQAWFKSAMVESSQKPLPTKLGDNLPLDVLNLTSNNDSTSSTPTV